MLKSLFDSGKPSVSKLVESLPRDLLQELETNEQQAGQFVCEVLQGNVPGAFENLAKDLATDVWDEIQAGFSDVTSFIEALPTIAPEILDDILSDGEDVVSVIEEVFTNPQGALTLIEGDVKTVISDIESVASGIWHGFTCLFVTCTDSSTSLNPIATLSSSCKHILAAASTTYSPTDIVAISSTSYPTAEPTSIASYAIASQTSTETLTSTQPVTSQSEVATKASSTFEQETSIQETTQTLYTQSTTDENKAGATVSSTSSQSTTTQGNTQPFPQGSGGGNVAIPLNGFQVSVLQAWVGTLVCLVFVFVL